jgi:hypothetical protein
VSICEKVPEACAGEDEDLAIEPLETYGEALFVFRARRSGPWRSEGRLEGLMCIRTRRALGKGFEKERVVGALLLLAVAACSSSGGGPGCFASGAYTFPLIGESGNPPACGVYDGATVTVTLTDLHYMATAPGSTGSANVMITRSGASSPEMWSCKILGFSSCAQLEVYCPQGTNYFDVELSTEAGGANDFAQFAIDQGEECYGNYKLGPIDKS